MSLLLAMIYIAFISLGLPDALLGSAWPSMRVEMGVPVSYAGILAMIISIGTIISSLLSDRLTRKLGTGRVTAISVAVTAVALLGFSITRSFGWLCVIALPYGLGAGAVDAALNNYVALHYKAKHMSWLHCFWGVGATLGPYIMGACLAGGQTWNSGYRVISIIQVALTAALFCTLRLWKGGGVQRSETERTESLSFGGLWRLKGAKAALLSFFCYCAVEQTAGLWGASYMVMSRGMAPEEAAKWTSVFYLGITAGRFLCGFIAMKWSDKQMVRLGQGIMAVGILLLLLPLGNVAMGAGLLMIGMGCAPIYPSLLHATPENFGVGHSQAMMGVQMACAYLGTTLMPPLFGLIAQHISIQLYPFYLMVFLALMLLAAERLNRLEKHPVLKEK